MESGKISERQMAFLLTPVMLSTIIYIVPQLEAKTVQQDAWIVSLLPVTALTILSVLLVTSLGNRFPGLTFIEYLQSILGRPLGKALGVLYALFFTILGSYVLRELGMFLSVTIMPRTPVAVFMVTMMIVVFYAVRNGIEVVARVSELILPIMIIVILGVVILTYNHVDLRRLLPIGEHSPGSILSTALVGTSLRAEIFVAAMFFPALNKQHNINRNLIMIVILVGIILASAQIALVGVFGGAEVANMEYPFFSLARIISLASIINRLEILLVLVFVLGVFIKLSVFTYAATLATSQALGFKQFQFLLYPIALCMIALGDNFFGNIAEYANFAGNVYPAMGLIFELLIPIFLYPICLIKHQTGRNRS